MQTSPLWRSLLLAAVVGSCAKTSHGQTAAGLRFTQPSKSELQGTVDLEIIAPPDTTAVRFFLDGTQLSELTDDYATATKTTPLWHTVMATEWFSPGPHELSAIATTTGGTIRTAMQVVFTAADSTPRLNLDGAWHFSAADDLPLGSMEGASPSVAAPNFDDRSWTNVVVPDSLEAVDKRWMNPSGLLGTYRRNFSLPQGKAQNELYLKSDSCFWSCRYFVNGFDVGASTGGYLPRRLRITAATHPGVNSLAVIVDSRVATMGVFKKLRYYYWNYSGLLQDIALEQEPPVALAEFRAEGSADGTLSLYPSTLNTTGHSEQLPVSIRVLDSEGHTVFTATQKILVPPAEGVTEAIQLKLKNIQLWDLDHPNLYTVVVATSGTELSEKTGFRDIVGRDGDLFLNGKPVLGLQGFDRHADYPGLGKTQPEGLADREIKLLHDKGFRLFRPAHYPTTKAELDAADKYGMLVLEEINVTGFSGAQLKDPATIAFAHDQLERLIARDRSHPSIFAWSIGNENRTDQPGSETYVSDVISYGKGLDHTRPFTEVSAQLRHDICYSYMDFLAVNIYAGWYTDNLSDVVSELDALATYAGNKPMVITEYGAEAVSGRPGTGKGTEYYQALTVDVHNRLLLNRPHFIGKMYWTSTEFVVGPKWDGGNPDPVPPFHTKGLLTYFRQPKLAWRVMFSPVEMDTIPPIEAGTSLPAKQTIHVVVHNREPRTIKGRLLVTPPKGTTVSTTELPFSIEPEGKSDLSFELEIKQIVKEKNAEGTVRAVIDSDTEAMPELLHINNKCTACAP